MRYPFRSCSTILILLLGILQIGSSSTEAATFLTLDDATLADSAPIIIEARVISREPAPAIGRPAIDYLVEIEDLIKGFLPGSALIVRLPGGVLAEGRGLKIAGVPTFAEAERLLLFLSPHQDGTFTLHQMALGAFRFDASGPKPILWRDLAGAHPMRLPGEAPQVEIGRDALAFRAWLRDRIAGEKRQRDYLVPLPESAKAKIRRKFRGIVSSTEPPPLGCGENGGHGVRWFEFDRGGSIPFQTHVEGQPGVPQTRIALKRAIAAWNAAANTNIRYERDGVTEADAGLTEFDGVNAILFEDPNNEISGRFERGGFLALGGPWFSCDLVEYKGEKYHPIFGADIVTQDGLENLFNQFDDPMTVAEELLAHELGHTLGLAHSDEPEALMFADLHADGRGALLDADDLAAVLTLYDAESSTAPVAPSNLWAAPLESGKVRLTWQDNSLDETGFRLDLRWEGTFVEIPVALAAGTREVNIAGLQPATEYVFRVRAVHSDGSSTPSNLARVTTLGEDPPCVVDQSRLCLLDGRFEVQVRFRNQHADGIEGQGTAVPATGETGMFWFFSQENIELTVKMLDGTRINDHYWFIYGALSDVEYWIDIKDHLTGRIRTYHNPPGNICGQADRRAFSAAALAEQRPFKFRYRPSASTLDDLRIEPVAMASVDASAAPPSHKNQSCETNNERLCLLENRFSVEVDWRSQENDGFGRAIAGTDNSGYFWFFHPNNVELAIKILDGRNINGHFWVFYGALSDVEYSIRVTDSLSGASRVYHNLAGEVCGHSDLTAFP